eukprot:jgi/Mesvir1/17486/Mv26488-RA.1
MTLRCRFANAEGTKKGQKVSWTTVRNLASFPMMDAVCEICIMSGEVGPEKLSKLVELAKDVLECVCQFILFEEKPDLDGECKGGVIWSTRLLAYLKRCSPYDLTRCQGTRTSSIDSWHFGRRPSSSRAMSPVARMQHAVCGNINYPSRSIGADRNPAPVPRP